MCVTIFCVECIHQWMRTRYRYMWPVPCTPHCTVYPGPVQGTAAPATNQSHNPELAPPTCNQFLPPPPAPPAPPPTYLSIISSPRNISMTNIYSRDGASARTSPAPHLSCVKSCNQASRLRCHTLEALDDTDPESILYSKQIAMYLIVDHKRI